MRVTLLESDRRVLQTAEYAFLSILAHGGVIWLAAAATSGGIALPETEREARVFFLLPPDRVDVRSHQPEVFQWGRIGADVDNGRITTESGEGWLTRRPAVGRREEIETRSGARGDVPVGPDLGRPDSVFSVLEVDSVVQRFEWSAAPIYPPDLLANGTEGVVYAQFVVDTTGMVDTTSIRLLTSAHPGFSTSVRDALGHMHFRPAMRARQRVRQLVEQHFRFTINPTVARQVS